MTMISEIMPWPVELHFDEANAVHHYEITPYVFNPQMATKIQGNEYLDMGQGILHILGHLHDQHINNKNSSQPPSGKSTARIVYKVK